MAQAVMEPEWIQKLKHGGGVPLLDFKLCSHGWASPPGDHFLVRGPNYKETQKKVPAGEWLLQPLAFDWVKSSSKICHILSHPHCRVAAALRLRADTSHGDTSEKPFVWAFNIQLSNKENHSLVMYYVSFGQPEKGSLMQRFLDGDDAFRNGRLKFLASLVGGPWIVRAAVGERGTVAMVGRAFNCKYIKEENYIEVDIDVGSNMIAMAAAQVAIGAISLVSIDFAFVLEAQTQRELPERVLGALRVANMDLASATFLEPPFPAHIKKPISLWKPFNKLQWRAQDREVREPGFTYRSVPDHSPEA